MSRRRLLHIIVTGTSLAGLLAVAFWPQWVAMALQPVAGGFSLPTYATHAGDGSGRLFVVEKAGRVLVVPPDGRVLPDPFLDLRSRVGAREFEQGLFSIAFHPRYLENGRVFVDYTDLDGAVVVAEYRVSDDPNRADPDGERVVLRIPKTRAYHNGGQLKFGPDGTLYVGVGDDGTPENAQDRGGLLGKILRLDVDGGEPYASPVDNPFGQGTGARAEIWAYGLRNPWRFSFDRATGDLYIADVGGAFWEEVNVQPAATTGGQNYGWPTLEGPACAIPPKGCRRAGLAMPVAWYDRPYGCAIAGGYVYRGTRVPDWVGMYFFSDWCSGRIWGMRRTGATWGVRQLLDTDLRVSSFGEGEDGQLYVVDYGTGTLFSLEARRPTPTLIYTVNRGLGLVLLVSLCSAFMLIPALASVLRRTGSRGGLLAAGLGRVDSGIAGIGVGITAGIIAAVSLETMAGPLFHADLKRLTAVVLTVIIVGLLAAIGHRLGRARRGRALLPLVGAVTLFALSPVGTTLRLPLLGVLHLGVLYPAVFVPLVLVLVGNATRMETGIRGLDATMALIALGGMTLIAVQIRATTAAVVLLAGLGAVLGAVYCGWPRARAQTGDLGKLMIGVLLSMAALLGRMEVVLIVVAPHLLDLLVRALNRFRGITPWGTAADGRLRAPEGAPQNLSQVLVRAANGLTSRQLTLALLGLELVCGIAAILLSAHVLQRPIIRW